MKNEILNRYQMLLSVQSFLDTNSVIWSSIPIFNTFKTMLDDLIQGAKENMRETGVSTLGLTGTKNDLKEQIAIKGSILSGALSAYASVSDNQELLKNGSFTKSDINNLRDAELPERMTFLVSLVSSHRKALLEYGITKDQETDMKTSLDDFRELVGQPRLKQSQANLAKKATEELISSAMDLLNTKLDKVMLQFQFTNPQFYEGYKRARVIVD